MRLTKFFIPDDASISEAHSSPMLTSRGSKSATPSPVAPNSRRGTSSASSQEWLNNEDDIDRLVTLHQNRNSLSSLGVCIFNITSLVKAEKFV